MEIIKIIKSARRIGCAHFEEFASKTNTNVGKKVEVVVLVQE
ncbi:hypothetical protein P378_14745 [Desulforamulus profundi]|uniref:Uncharacterized protein n=1 Tax=Desulforamulus profundi TaxID=1383067 RepID=A0A2C6M918_9FIRM|nr:hypothetical protein [Desulforamulus profundi]PHJ37619.1 hypothetical protein P378_14745 [Desulforamulus profundi]